MKKSLYSFIHRIIRIPFFESCFKKIVEGKNLDAFAVRFIPPFASYKNPTYKRVQKGELILHANLYDYNDWKAFWGLKEADREKLYRLAEKARTVVDIGANNGWVLLNMATSVKKNKGVAFGFEPFPSTFERCKRNIESSNVKNISIYNVACGEIESTFQMEVMHEANSGQNRIVKETDKVNTVTIRTVKLDDQLLHAPKIDLIKIDVEGFELHVLKGAERILRQDRPIIFIEINDPLLKANNTSAWRVLDHIKNNLHYRVTYALTDQEISEGENLTDCHFDAICYPKTNNLEKQGL